MKKNIALAYLAQFINLGASLILLPFTVRILEPEYLAVWYIFSALAGFLILMEFEFQFQ
jgi:O-antigen/teichoic acid export membrane protein